MKTEKFKGTIASAYGKQLDKEIPFEGTFEAYETLAEAEAAKDILNNDEILAVINNKRKASARATATTEALQKAGIEKPDPNSPDVLREQMIATYMKLQKISREDAEKVVSQLLG